MKPRNATEPASIAKRLRHKTEAYARFPRSEVTRYREG